MLVVLTLFLYVEYFVVLLVFQFRFESIGVLQDCRYKIYKGRSLSRFIFQNDEKKKTKLKFVRIIYGLFNRRIRALRHENRPKKNKINRLVSWLSHSSSIIYTINSYTFVIPLLILSFFFPPGWTRSLRNLNSSMEDLNGLIIRSNDSRWFLLKSRCYLPTSN